MSTFDLSPIASTYVISNSKISNTRISYEEIMSKTHYCATKTGKQQRLEGLHAIMDRCRYVPVNPACFALNALLNEDVSVNTTLLTYSHLNFQVDHENEEQRCFQNMLRARVKKLENAGKNVPKELSDLAKYWPTYHDRTPIAPLYRSMVVGQQFRKLKTIFNSYSVKINRLIDSGIWKGGGDQAICRDMFELYKSKINTHIIGRYRSYAITILTTKYRAYLKFANQYALQNMRDAIQSSKTERCPENHSQKSDDDDEQYYPKEMTLMNIIANIAYYLYVVFVAILVIVIRCVVMIAYLTAFLFVTFRSVVYVAHEHQDLSVSIHNFTNALRLETV